LRIVFHIEKDSIGNLTGTMDSPDQGAYGIKVDTVNAEGDKVQLGITKIFGSFSGTWVDEKNIEGTWKQGTASFPLDLVYTEKVVAPKRPQEPKPPFEYEIEKVKIQNEKEGITLSGTLTIPRGEGPFPGVILVSGSGPQDRNEEVFGHRPFWVIADYLTNAGVAVLRYDDRGIGESTGDFVTATTADFASDAYYVLMKLQNHPRINPDKTGIVGHSEGGLIAPMVAAESEDVDFIVMLAGPGLPGKEILLLQMRLIAEASGVSEYQIEKNIAFSKKTYEIVLREPDTEKAEKQLEILIDENIDDLSAQYGTTPETTRKTMLQGLSQINGVWFRFFLAYDPRAPLEKVKCPVLALNGEMDLQVPPEENLTAIKNILVENRNKNYEVIELEGLNHLFQHSETGSPAEYAKIEETFAEEALVIIRDWILELK